MKKNVVYFNCILFILVLFCFSNVYGLTKKKSKALHSKEQSKILHILPYYTKYKDFTRGKCFFPRANLVCAYRSKKLRVYAEKETKDSFRLTIMVRKRLSQKFTFYIYQVLFDKDYGVRVTDISEYYDVYHEVLHNISLPLSLRKWLLHIQVAIDPDYMFQFLTKKS